MAMGEQILSCRKSTFAIVSERDVTVNVHPFRVSPSGHAVLYVNTISTVPVRLPRLPVHPRRNKTVRSPENRLNIRISDSQKDTKSSHWDIIGVFETYLLDTKVLTFNSLLNEKLTNTVVLLPLADP